MPGLIRYLFFKAQQEIKQQLLSSFKSFKSKMAEPTTEAALTSVDKMAEKRTLENAAEEGSEGPPTKKDRSLTKKKKIALLAAYNGKGYYGVQVQKGFPTIEGELFPALVSVGAWEPEWVEKPSMARFQRGSRTDKGVSACGQTFSLNVRFVPDLVPALNAVLPDQIRILGFVKTTKTFDSKNWCDARTYMYMTPTFAFADIEKFISDDYRIDSDRLLRVRKVLQNFVGTHNFHNFTSGVKYEEKCARRYIISWDVSEPFVRDGLEFVTLRVKGQSFMLHQIRKMIGVTVAVVRGYCGEELIQRSYGSEKIDIPKAPGLGLVLEDLHFEAYNKKFGGDGIHDKIDWDKVRTAQSQFKEDQILTDIVQQERADRSMWEWMRTLNFHSFGGTREEVERWQDTKNALNGKKKDEQEGSIGSGGDQEKASGNNETLKRLPNNGEIDDTLKTAKTEDSSDSVNTKVESVLGSEVSTDNCFPEKDGKETSATDNCQSRTDSLEEAIEIKPQSDPNISNCPPR